MGRPQPFSVNALPFLLRSLLLSPYRASVYQADRKGARVDLGFHCQRVLLFSNP